MICRRSPDVDTAVRESVVLKNVDTVMPDTAVTALNSFNGLVGSSFFPRYLEPFATERIVAVGPPPPAIARDPEVAAAAPSVQ